MFTVLTLAIIEKEKNTPSIHKKNRLPLIVENSAKNILGCFLLACLSVYF